MAGIKQWTAVFAGVCWLSATAASPSGAVAPTLQTVYRSPQVLVQAATLAPEQSKAKALPIQVVIDGLGVPLLLPGGTQASSAVVHMQVRCQSGVWAVEKLTAFDGPAGSGALRASGQTPAGQLSWNRLKPSEAPNRALLQGWLDQAADQQCKNTTAAPAS